MRKINRAARKTMDKLTRGLGENGAYEGHVKFDSSNGTYMPVHVEFIGERGQGKMFSVSHYYEQNGDTMADPDMEFIRTPDGNYYPMAYRLDSLGVYQVSIELGNIKAGEPKFRIRPSMQRDHANFANQWMENIEDQQDLSKGEAS